jgi:hypothetical protein
MLATILFRVFCLPVSSLKTYCIMRSFITCTLHQYYSGDQIKEDEMGGACSTHGRDEKCIQYFGGKPEGKRLGRPRCTWEDNIRMELRELRWEGVGWIHLAQDRDQE